MAVERDRPSAQRYRICLLCASPVRPVRGAQPSRSPDRVPVPRQGPGNMVAGAPPTARRGAMAPRGRPFSTTPASRRHHPPPAARGESGPAWARGGGSDRPRQDAPQTTLWPPAPAPPPTAPPHLRGPKTKKLTPLAQNRPPAKLLPLLDADDPAQGAVRQDRKVADPPPGHLPSSRASRCPGACRRRRAASSTRRRPSPKSGVLARRARGPRRAPRSCPGRSVRPRSQPSHRPDSREGSERGSPTVASGLIV